MMVGGRPWEILHGDVRRVAKTLPDNHFDAVLCDPPYGLSFMGRRWDYSVPSAMVWSEIERVMKPGAHAMIFGGPRTFHRVCVAVEDGGLIPRDLLMWIFGSGFPKSQDAAKGIDQKKGVKRKRIAPRALDPNAVTEEAKAWEGYGTALKPGYEPVILARKLLEGTVAENAIRWGTGALAIDACRIEAPGESTKRTNAAEMGYHGGNLAPSYQTGSDAGRWPANVILTHSEACSFVGMRPSKDKAIKTRSTGEVVSQNVAMGGLNYGRVVVGVTARPDEEIWECVDGCPVKMMDEQSGNRPGMSGGGKHRADYGGGMFGGIDSTHTARGDSGGASRFFYTAKADRYQREAGLDGMKKTTAWGVGALGDGGRGKAEVANIHPTVKPIDLIRYLASIILPPKQGKPRRILVPFCGVSSEMIGCMQAGWDEVIGIEREAEYIAIAKERIAKGGVFSGLMDRKMRRRKKRCA